MFFDYYSKSKAHNIAVSAANLACNELYFDKNWDKGFDDIDYQDGNFPWKLLIH